MTPKDRGPGEKDYPLSGDAMAIHAEENWRCRIWPYLSAFFAALTVGSIMTMIGGFWAEYFKLGQSILLTTLFAVLTIVFFLDWRRFCRIGKNEWRPMVWSSTLVILAACYGLSTCIGGNWMILGAAAFLASAFLIFEWFRDNTDKSESFSFLIYFILAIVACFITAWWTVPTVITCV
ncbi:MAG: hypothetical protein AAF206_21345 [Bacteroidota bacterium]